MTPPPAAEALPAASASEQAAVAEIALRIVLHTSRSSSPGIRWRSAVRKANVKPYFNSESILNIGMYIEMMMIPTMTPTPIIMIGSTIDVSDCTDASTSSS